MLVNIKKIQACAKDRMNTNHQPMSIEEVNHEMHIPIFDHISTNLDGEYTLYYYEHNIIDLDVDLPNILAMQLVLTSTSEHSETLTSLDLDIFLFVLAIAPLVSYPPSLIPTR